MKFRRLRPLELDALIFSKWDRLPNGCRPWRGTLSSSGSPVVWFEGQVVSVKALLDYQVYGALKPPKRALCKTPQCAHPRHYARPVRSSAVS